MENKVYLVGAGPGSPDLITVRGLEILRQADVIVYDYLVDKRLLEQAKDKAELICSDRSGKRRYSDVRLRSSSSAGLSAETEQESSSAKADGFLIPQKKINELMVKKAKQDKKVVRLKNGDPFIFGRASGELEALIKNKIEFEIVPGVTAANAASSFSGVPLTDRRFSSSVVFVTGHEAANKKKNSIDWKGIANCGTIVLYMAAGNISKIVDALIEAGKSRDIPVVAISRAGDINQRIIKARLKNIAKVVKKEPLTPPAIFIIGEVAGLEKRFNWLNKNKRFLFTGLSKERFFIEGTYFHLPLIRIEPLDDYGEFDNYLKNINNYDWIIFTSRYGVEYFFKRLKVLGYDSRILNGIKIAAIGNSTKKQLLDYAILADLVPREESSQGLIGEFKKIDIKDKRIFLPRSDISDKGLSRAFEKLGADVTTSFAYRNAMPADLPDLDLNSFDEIMFTSPSGVRNFVKRYKALPRKVKVNCIGEVTLREAKRCHLLD